MIFILQRPVTATQKIYLKGISLFITFFNPPGDVCLNNRRHFFPRCSIVPAAYCFCDIREPLLHFLLNYLCICDNSWAIILLEHRTASSPDNRECRNVAKPIKQHFSTGAGPSWAAEGNNQSLDFRRSLFIMQSGTSPYTFHPASSSWQEEGHQQSLKSLLLQTVPSAPLPPHIPLFEALPVTATRTNWNFWWWRSKDLANVPIKKQGKNVYLKYFW